MTQKQLEAGYDALGKRYVVLQGKTPTHGYADENKRLTFQEAKDFDDVAMVVKDGFCIMDFDNADDAEVVLRIIDDRKIKTDVLKTSRGVHAVFKSTPRVKKAFSGTRLAFGLYGDRKVGGTNCLDKIKQDGCFRDWIRTCSDDEMDELPAFMLPVKAPKDTFDFKGMTDGSGRNQALFNYIAYLQSRGFSHDEIKEIISIINTYVFADPLDENEIATICRDDAFLPDNKIEENMITNEDEDDGEKRFPHEKYALELMAEYHIIEFHGVLYIYDDGYYVADDKVVERKLIEMYPKIKQHQRTEVMSYIRILAHLSDKNVKINPYIINLQNTRLDVRTGELLDFTPTALDFVRIPVIYDPDAKCPELDHMIDRVFCGQKDLVDVFYEIVGSMLIKSATMQKGVIAVGRGANGKSTIIDMLQAFIGENNYSTIALENLGSRFLTAELENKMANLGDDIESEKPIKETSVMKKVIAGNRVSAERKGQDPFVFKPYATHVYSCNRIPRSMDKSEGFYRRWLILPFDAHFTSSDSDFDPMILDKITTPQALAHLLNEAIAGAQRLIARGHFQDTKSTSAMLETYKTVNSNVLSWIDDQELNVQHFLETPRNSLYEEFTDWCKESGISPSYITGRYNFYEEVRQKYGFDKTPRQSIEDGKRYFRMQLDV